MVKVPTLAAPSLSHIKSLRSMQFSKSQSFLIVYKLPTLHLQFELMFPKLQASLLEAFPYKTQSTKEQKWYQNSTFDTHYCALTPLVSSEMCLSVESNIIIEPDWDSPWLMSQALRLRWLLAQPRTEYRVSKLYGIWDVCSLFSCFWEVFFLSFPLLNYKISWS